MAEANIETNITDKAKVAEPKESIEATELLSRNDQSESDDNQDKVAERSSSRTSEPIEDKNERPVEEEALTVDDRKDSRCRNSSSSESEEIDAARAEKNVASQEGSPTTAVNGANETKVVESGEPPKANSEDKADEDVVAEAPKKTNEDVDAKDDERKRKDAPGAGSRSLELSKADDDQEKEIEKVELKEGNGENDDVLATGEITSTKRVSAKGKTAEEKAVVEKDDERSEVGIVGPPTAVSDLINEELRAESALSAGGKAQDHLVEWVHNSVTTGALIIADIGDENEIQDANRRRRRRRRRNLRDKGSKRKKMGNILTMSTRKSQRVISNIIKKSIKCLNKMHAMEGTAGNGKKVDAAEKTREEDSSRASPKVPQNQQNGAALPEETAAAATTVDRLRSSSIKKEPLCDLESESKSLISSEVSSQQKGGAVSTRCAKSEVESGRKRKSTDAQLPANGSSIPKKSCIEQREQYISSLVGCDKVTAEELAARADQLRTEVQALDELARAKEIEWNEILSMRKLKEEAYLRVERRRQVLGFMEGNGQLADTLPPASLSLGPEWESSGSTTPVSKEKCSFGSKEDLPEDSSQDSPAFKKEKNAKSALHRQLTPPKQGGENGRKQAETLSPENRQIGEGRQGTIVDVRSIIADYRLRHPETVPRRGRRMRNSVNVSLGPGGAVVDTGSHVDSRPSSTDSCKSNPNLMDQSSMSFKDVLVQFAKLSQQQGEPVKTPQNYPDVTLHPVAPSPAAQATPPQQTGSLLHGILTKSQSPRPTTFSPTLARLLTAPERERNTPTVASIPQQSVATQHLLQAYQGSNPVSISDLLSSSKARTEITITPVVNTAVQSHSNNLIHVDDVEEETAVIEDREARVSSVGRDGREDSPPRCQGCHERAAQFVCAGCGNQWYCSRECQVAAWDEHSEVCSG